MPLMPKRVKFRKTQRGVIKGVAHKGHYVAYGDYGLQSLDIGWISNRQLEAGRVAATHFLGREGKVYMRVFPHKSVTATPEETRMGKGKGEPEYYVAVVKPGTVIFELGGIPEETARQTLNRVAHKLPIRTRFVARRQRVSG
ncbi:MAG: 50S ribosomal protein L16 [Planctomycetota bacterium]